MGMMVVLILERLIAGGFRLSEMNCRGCVIDGVYLASVGKWGYQSCLEACNRILQLESFLGRS